MDMLKTLAVTALLCTAASAFADESLPAGSASEAQIVDGTDPTALVEIIQDLGYRANLEVDGEGDPMIRSSVGGTQFALVFYGCSEQHDNCQILLFKAGYELNDKVGMDVINQWNATRLFGRAYLDEVSDPWIELVLNMQGGVTRAQFEKTFEWWEMSVGEFEDEIGV
jgi:hypothetical protein